MGQPLILSLGAPFPDPSLWEGVDCEREWHLARATHYFHQAEKDPDALCYYSFGAFGHTALAALYSIPLINVLVYAIQYIAYAIFAPDCMETAQKEALNSENLEGAFLLYKRGVDWTLTNDTGETLADLCIKTPRAKAYTYELLLNGFPFNSKAPPLLDLFQSATEENRQDILLKLVEEGVEPHAWTRLKIPPSPHSMIPPVLSPFLNETGQSSIGRLKEKQAIERIFRQQYRSHPLLIGPAGVGKTALANSCSPKKSVTVNLKLLKGASENQVIYFKQFIQLHKDDIVLILEDLDDVPREFLDRFLSTLDSVSYLGCARKEIDLPPFTPLTIEEPSDQELLEIAKDTFPHVEEEVIKQTISLCKRHLPYQKLPQSLLVILDRAQAFLETQYAQGSLKRQRGEAIGAQESQEIELQNWERKLSFLNQIAVPKESPMRQEAEETIVRLKKAIGENRLFFSHISLPLIKHILAPYEPPENIEGFLKKEVIGQDHVIKEVAKHLRLVIHDETSQDRAQGRLHFVGLPGTGKTELAKAIAKYLNIPFVHIPMTDFKTVHDVNTLTGVAPGYVGHEGGGLILNAAKKGPMVLLLDEIDKCHPQVALMLLHHLLEEGEMIDPVSREKVKMHHTFVIFTSNFGSSAILEALNPPSGVFFRGTPRDCSHPQTILDLITPAMLQFFSGPRASLLRRFTTLPFSPLQNKEAIKAITLKFLQEEHERVKEKWHITLTWTEDFVSSFSTLVTPLEGFSPIREAIQVDLRAKILEKCLEKGGAHHTLRLDFNNEEDILDFIED